MPRIYKSVRIAYETKKWLNDIISKYEEQLKKDKDKLIIEYEDKLRASEEFKNYSPTLLISVSSGSIVEAAYHYSKSLKLTPSDWLKISEEAKKTAKEELKKQGILDVGSITPRFLIGTDILENLEKMQWELKPDTMQRNLQLNYILKLVIYCYYKHVCKKDE
ncbi:MULTISPECIES: hypothetical protein [Enterococcus]|jgi:hypothetical protein|uniref:hypothetical protein n=1 Tax=Enterococcus TaxID=1350 RepID=UPI00088B5C93|nr:hypothetical protein [Enterococcus casseliflavus]SDK67179.1 hypothetical protein SAMN05216513_11052 [Enterococcus casseliflavus]